MRTKPSITVANLVKRFGDVDAVNDITFSVQPGEIIGFVGPNGAGKTTTISMLMGFIAPTKGSVTVLDQTIAPESSHRVHRHIGYVSGDMVLPGHLTGKQYLAFMMARQGRVLEQYNRLVRQLNPVLDRPLKTLSRGNKQKIALLAALQHEPTILVLDEPTSGLDPLMQDVFLRTLKNEAKRGVTVLMSSHILSEVSDICTRIIFMRAGKLILDQPIQSITAQLGKRIIITTKDAVKLRQRLPAGTKLIAHSTRTLELGTEKEALSEIVRWIGTKSISDLTIEDRNLDDIFHELYEPKNRSSRT